MKGIILAGGSGSRLYPLTKSVNKQLLPVHDKPLIYYPLTSLISAGIYEILIISSPEQIGQFRELLGNGERLGIKLSYDVQEKPNGIPEAFLIAEEFIANDNVTLVLGDNLFVDSGEIRSMVRSFKIGAAILGYQVSNSKRFGVIEFDAKGLPLEIVEKPKNTASKTIVPGLYIYDANVCDLARSLEPSVRGELEITDLNNAYLRLGNLQIKNLSRGSVWIDAGTPNSISRASRYIATIEDNHGMKIGCPEEAALVRQFVSSKKLKQEITKMPDCEYKAYLEGLIKAGSLSNDSMLLPLLTAV